MKGWDLGWPRLTIAERDGTTTFLVRYNEIEAADAGFMRLKQELDKLSKIKSFESNALQIATSKDRGRSLVSAWHPLGHDYFFATAFVSRHVEAIHDYLTKQLQVFACELTHSRRVLKLDRNMKAIIQTGMMLGDKDPASELLTLYRFKRGRTILAMARVQYEHEHSECAPTITHFEVKRKHRGKSLGKRFIPVIESEMKQHGFDRLWATDAVASGNMGFWEKLGFDIDYEEAFKWL
jgi:GNAT superfamily N-acetyltransferase